jgi:FixJ family two-component response regulator
MPIKPSITSVGDDASVPAATAGLLRSLGFIGEAANDFFDSDRPPVTACLIADVRMRGIGGLALDVGLAACGNRRIANEWR